MSTRLFTLLPIMGWKKLLLITPKEAAKLTNGNTDKFMNKDFWVFGPPCSWKTEKEIPIGIRAVYYHDTQWWIVRKVKK